MNCKEISGQIIDTLKSSTYDTRDELSLSIGRTHYRVVCKRHRVMVEVSKEGVWEVSSPYDSYTLSNSSAIL